MANNRKINGGGLRTASDPNISAPLFNFYPYETGKTYYNNSSQVDFVTYDGNLYVCTDFGGKYASEPTPERNGGFLLIVKKGEDGQQGLTGRPGIDGSTPEIKVRFEGKQLVIYDAATQTRLASSPELVGPTWKPVQKDNKITWKLEEGTPSSIDLDELRPKEEHPVLFRLNSDNTKRSNEETGPGYYIQWKREGNEEWTDLMSISELMNIALAGISFWWADDENGATDANGDPIQRLHVGHKQVKRATYDASKLGNKRIADVELGEVLFDAGEIPFPNYDDEIAALNAFLCDLQGDISIVRNLIPTDYVKSVSGIGPNPNGDVPLNDLYYTKPQSDARFLTQHQPIKTLGGQQLIGTGDLGLKTVNGNTLLTVNPNGEDVKVGTVRAITINNVQGVVDQNGAVNMTIPVGDGASDPIDAYTKDEADDRFQPKGDYLTDQDLDGLVRGVRVNNGQPNYPENGIVNITVGDGVQPVDTSDCVKVITINNQNKYPVNGVVDLGDVGEGGNDGVGVDNIEFRLSGNSLEYHVSINGVWQPNWTTIPLPSGSTGSGEHIELSIEDGALYISRNGGDPEYVGPVGNASGNWVKDIAKNENTLVVTYWNGTSNTITIPSGDSGSTVSIRQVLLNGTHIATITVDGVAYDIFAPTGSYNPDDPSNPGGTGEDGITLDLTNEVNTVPVDKDKKTLSTASFLTELHAYSGSRTEIGFDQNDVTISVSPNITGINVVKNIDNNPKKFQINVNSGITVNEEVKIAFTLWENDSSRVARTAVYTLVPLRLSQSEMFYLELNPDIIKVDSEGNYTSETVSALPHWLLDGDPQSIVGWNDSSKINDVSVKYHVYYKIDNGNYTFYTSPVDITSASDQAVFELRYYYNNNKTDYIVMDGPEHVLILRDGQRGPDGVSITSQVRYYKASDQSTGITAPNIDADPTLAANGSWLTTSNSMQLSESNPYLWFFERIIYSDDSKWQSDPVIIRYFNSAVNVNYQEIENNVLQAIGGDIDDLNERLSVIVDTNGNIITDGDNGLIGVITNYTDSNQKSFADLVVDAKEAEIKQWAGSVIDDQLVTAGTTINGLKGQIDTKVTAQDVDGKISDARTSWDIDGITSSVTKAQYVWVKDSDGSILPYNGESSKTGYTKTLVANAMSAIQQESDKISILVGQDGNVKAGVIVDSINGGNVTIDANRIDLNGETFATAVKAVEISADQITSGTINANRIGANSIDASKINAENLQVAAANITGQLTASQIDATDLYAKTASFDYLTVNGQAIGTNNSLGIRFGNADTATTEANTIYFLYE